MRWSLPVVEVVEQVMAGVMEVEGEATQEVEELEHIQDMVEHKHPVTHLLMEIPGEVIGK